MPLKKKKHKGQNIPSVIRFPGDPPIMPIFFKKGKKRQNRPSEIRLSGVPPIMPIKTNNKKHTKGKKDHHKYVLQGSPL